jgi:broad-specificity NMP kinase
MLIVLCGIPGSGKTTLSNRIAAFYNASVYHYDEWRYDMKY